MKIAHAPDGAAPGRVFSLDARRIERALRGRSRYKYVHPRIEPEGRGWKIVSPNCSRNIDPEGGEIDIAWLVPVNEQKSHAPVATTPGAAASGEQRPDNVQGVGGWLLYSREHTQDCWRLRCQDTLPRLLDHLCADPDREFWR